ncbi:His/Gly/Thr/Pro-type tRNA ligase C-terminal domain-containing protein [Mesorhizobium sp. C432A]|uniref:His/Gly/Thr/Pro-type tRNA ligase C-terminal domain-containing protein n=1 Tax=Mesorhizobium sp. C432A TaxID=2956836 RepID=UPI00257894F8|nr:His/Gly/Thr/Pro-type tRNA ligase C-terminal domain-containing protein [Mesorhizobium sp. C432A]WJI54880.1 His/Gly/Thr/Pro-type tRNA ligase C-terminal domain-containing protein [Mesorhizobium sp. C432A]
MRPRLRRDLRRLHQRRQGCALRRHRPAAGRQVRHRRPDRPALAVIVGPRGVAAGEIEIKNRRTGERETLPVAEARKRFGATA